MNKILRDLINTEKIASFINNIIEKEKENNEIVEEVLKRIEKNNQYIKLEKYK